MAFTTTPYATLTQVKLALDAQTGTDDTWLQELIEEAQSDIDKFVGYGFQMDGTALTPATRLYDGNDGQTLLIDPCLSFATVTETTYNLFLGVMGVFQGNAQTYDITADCIMTPNNRVPGYLLRRLSGNAFRAGIQNYVIAGVFGYNAVPADISRATVRLVTHYVKIRDTNYSDQIAEVGGIKQHYLKQIPADVCEILTRYKKRSFRSY